jgi:RNA polymerase sigma-70 factor (ECF subfamily)
MPDRSDKQLIADYLKGDRASLEILIKRYLKPVYGFIFRYVGNAPEAEDITQEVFVRVWRNIKKFDPDFAMAQNRGSSISSKGNWDEQKSLAQYRNEVSGSGFKTWIFSIAKNASIDSLKKKKAIPFSKFTNEEGDNVLADTLVDPAPLPNELLERADAANLLASALEKLSPNYRAGLSLYYREQLNFREIAEVLDEPIDTVKSRHRRALIVLRKILVDRAE